VRAVDTNILVYAHRADSPWHDTARSRVRGLAEGTTAWAIPWPCLYEFLATVTHPRIYRPPTPAVAAVAQIDAWLESPSLVLLGESDAHWAALRSIVLAGRVDGPLVHDARVAALCVAHGVRELWTADRDFGRFPGVNAVNPLVQPTTESR
jgi:toxin-antitoxin system PIN domain toxin